MGFPGRIDDLQDKGSQTVLAGLHEHLAAQEVRQRLVQDVSGGRAGQEQVVFEPGQRDRGLLRVVHDNLPGVSPDRIEGTARLKSSGEKMPRRSAVT